MTSTAAALDRLAEEIKAEHDRAAHREEIIDRLFEENQALRHGLLQEALTPVRAGLYRLHDLAGREAARLRGAGQDGSLMEAIAAEVAEVLARTGAELLDVAPGDPYDAARHRATRTEPGPPGRVVAVLAEGFHQGERVLRKADVAIGQAVQHREDDA
ncbi:GrpE protein [Nonomuraea solani]|uniref:GrpE protein n=1 Tax=Nonomuraea solani TaxID=1144553 RepID=A0A1H6EQL2_9ACTN|nr:nucleotide exchange factor GrpE [Nonomuraea solani]SEH00148.1 GrpE protein [Nonomuraea solani]